MIRHILDTEYVKHPAQTQAVFLDGLCADLAPAGTCAYVTRLDHAQTSKEYRVRVESFRR